MMRSLILTGSLLSLACLAAPAQAQTPVAIDTVASIPEIELLITRHTTALDSALAEESRFEDQKGKGIRQSFGMLAVLGQSIAEHSGKASSKINGPALRDAALTFDRKGNHAQAKTALEQVHSVLEGKVTGEHAELHPWNKLINMHPMMEELNAGNSAILKVVKKPRGKPEEVLPATTWALLSITMQADTHEVKNPEDLPKWNAWVDEFRGSSLKLAEAIRAKNGEEGRKWFDKANETCDSCHSVFHKE